MCFFCRETLLALLFLTTFTVNKLRNGKDTARRQTLTRDICMRSAFLQETSTMHHPPFRRRHHEPNCHEYSSRSDHKNGRNVHNVKKFAVDIGTGFVGPGSVTSMRMLHREEKWPDLCTLLTTTVAMWLKGKPVFVRHKPGWTVMGRFWSAECSQRVKRIIFRSMVWSIFLTRWETLLPQSFRQVHSLQGTQPHAEKGKSSLD